MMTAATRLLLAAGVSAIYWATLAPTLTWRNGGTDGAELAAAAYVWGVAHPPGYPLYLTLMRLFQLIPLGDPAFRATLFSACAAVLAVLAVAAATLEALLPAGGGHRVLAYGGPAPLGAGWRERVGAIFAGASFAFGPLFWSQAVITEVYTLSAALLGLFVVAFGRWLRSPTRGSALALAGISSLLVSHQPVFAAALVPAVVVVWRQSRSRRTALPGHQWPAPLVAPLLLLGPLLMLTLWLRAAFQPSLNWGDPSTAARWLAHVTAEAYRPYFLARPLLDELPRVPQAAALLARQSGWPGMALAGLGLIWLWANRRAFAVGTAGVASFFAGFAVLYNAQGSEVYLLPTVQLLAIAAGVGAAWILRGVRRPLLQAALFALPLLLAWRLWTAWRAVDASRDREARLWGEALLRSAPPAALVRSSSEQHTFVLWYLQHVEGVRPDVAIVDDRLLAFVWYRHQLLRQYPQLSGTGIADDVDRGVAERLQRERRGSGPA